MDKIICLGKNYLEHANELGDAVPEHPVIFLKPPSILKSATQNGQTLELELPSGAGAVHHECEVVLRVGPQATIEAITLGLDMTLRDRQAEQKKKGHPWTTSKVFVDSAVVGPWIRFADFPEYLQTEFTFSIDGKIRQRGQAQEMRLSPLASLAYIQDFFPLREGDLIFTGTPAGVGPVVAGTRGELRFGDRIHFRVSWNGKN